MRQAFAFVAAIILMAVGSVHLYWAAGGISLKDGAIPSRDGKPVFSPSAMMTASVAIGLFAFAFLLLVATGVIPTPVPATLLRAAAGCLAVVFALRAVGDTRYVGFFKHVKGSPFAKRDTFIYSPLCVLLAVLIGIVAVA